MLKPRIHSSCFEADYLLRDCVGHRELIFSAELKEALIVITATNAVPTKCAFQGHCVHPNSNIELAKDQGLVICSC